LQIIPLAGNSRVELELTDADGTVHRNRLQVVGYVEEEKEIQESSEVLPGEEESAGTEQPGPEGPLGLLLYEMQRNSDGELQRFLQRLDPQEHHIESQEELIRHIYGQAGPESYSGEEVDTLLAEVLSDGDLRLLLQFMIENSDGALKAYLSELDPETGTFRTGGELLKHLEHAAETEGFTMDEVRKALVDSLGESLEVFRRYEQALDLSEGAAREILESMDLQESEVYTVDHLITLLDTNMEEKGINRKEREKILSRLFGDRYSAAGSGRGRINWPVAAGLALAAAGLIFLLIALGRRRKKGEKQQD
jgi:hypothetical protein